MSEARLLVLFPLFASESPDKANIKTNTGYCVDLIMSCYYDHDMGPEPYSVFLKLDLSYFNQNGIMLMGN